VSLISSNPCTTYHPDSDRSRNAVHGVDAGQLHGRLQGYLADLKTPPPPLGPYRRPLRRALWWSEGVTPLRRRKRRRCGRAAWEMRVVPRSKKTPPPLGPPYVPRHWATVGSWEGGVSASELHGRLQGYLVQKERLPPRTTICPQALGYCREGRVSACEPDGGC
jgi:hypothetical protein